MGILNPTLVKQTLPKDEIPIVVISKERAYKAALFVIIGYGLSNIIRLAGNIVLTRLLVPEFFGIMSLAQVFIMGLFLFSDIGIDPGIIRSNRSEDPIFLNTAWTLQVIRGPVLWFFSLIIAYPVALMYGEPILAMLIPVIGLSTIFEGIKSTSFAQLSKDLKQAHLAIVELSTQLISLVCIITVAYFTRSIWALVIGALLTSLLRTIWSHVINKSFHHRFVLERASLYELISFGKWIFISTAMMFLASQADKLLLGRLIPLSLLGVYTIAFTLAQLPKEIVTRIGGKVIFPYFSHYSHLPRHELKRKVGKNRKFLLLLSALVVSILASFGDKLIFFLYDTRYHQAGWILPLLAVGVWPAILTHTIDKSLFVIGEPKYLAFGNLFKFIYMAVIIPLSFWIAGVFGAVVAIALKDLPIYGVILFGLIKEKLHLLNQDITSTILLILTITFFLIVRANLNMGFPIHNVGW